MSLGYAEKLSYIEDVGNVGMTEFFDPYHLLQDKIEQLATLIQKSKHLVVFTGAGISTSCGIPDFRGPKGIWTLQREGKPLPEASLAFHRAMPGMTHMALVELDKAGILKYVISQNVDGLHLRSGIPREKLAELHGNSFMETCSSCGAEYLRDFEVETIGLKETSRRCSEVNCGAKLKDTVLDWEDALPSKEMNPAEKHCRMADLVLCLGTRFGKFTCEGMSTGMLWGKHGSSSQDLSLMEVAQKIYISLTTYRHLKPLVGVDKHLLVFERRLFNLNLQITPACNLPLKSLRGGGQIVIVNLQKTPKDKKASLVIHGLVDKVIKGVMELLNMRIPPYVRIDFFQIILTHSLSTDKRFVNWTIRVASVHGLNTRLPFIKSVEVTFSDNQKYKPAILITQPFQLKRRTISREVFDMSLKLMFSEGCSCRSIQIETPFDFEVQTEASKLDKDAIIQTLKDAPVKDSFCGQNAIIERTTIVAPKGEATVYAVVTNFKSFMSDSLTSNCDVQWLRWSINGTPICRKRSNSRKRKTMFLW